MKLIKVELEKEDIELIVSFFSDIKEKWMGGKNKSFDKLDELLVKFKNSLIMTDSRVAKLLRGK